MPGEVDLSFFSASVVWRGIATAEPRNALAKQSYSHHVLPCVVRDVQRYEVYVLPGSLILFVVCPHAHDRGRPSNISRFSNSEKAFSLGQEMSALKVETSRMFFIAAGTADFPLRVVIYAMLARKHVVPMKRQGCNAQISLHISR